ncbi:MAG: hypothetical protein A2X09_14195 [Bacteroidetes bacterium GWF2_43_11]|nr:MAG: hypothetical protein A2X09_14195 [Bacteroidetes bacterium GWF2_43_11]
MNLNFGKTVTDIEKINICVDLKPISGLDNHIENIEKLFFRDKDNNSINSGVYYRVIFTEDMEGNVEYRDFIAVIYGLEIKMKVMKLSGSMHDYVFHVCGPRDKEVNALDKEGKVIGKKFKCAEYLRFTIRHHKSEEYCHAFIDELRKTDHLNFKGKTIEFYLKIVFNILNLIDYKLYVKLADCASIDLENGSFDLSLPSMIAHGYTAYSRYGFLTRELEDEFDEYKQVREKSMVTKITFDGKLKTVYEHVIDHYVGRTGKYPELDKLIRQSEFIAGINWRPCGYRICLIGTWKSLNGLKKWE